MPTPASNKTVEPAAQLPVDYPGSADNRSKALPDLAALVISPSGVLRFIYRTAYSLFALAITLALYPYLTDPDSHTVQRILLLMLLVLFVLLLWYGFKRQMAAIPQGCLAYQAQRWQLTGAGIRQDFHLRGAVLCWPWVIILPLSELESGTKQTLVLAKDALSAADQARLRTWLRACLRPKG